MRDSLSSDQQGTSSTEDLKQQLARCLVADKEGALPQDAVTAFFALYDQVGVKARSAFIGVLMMARRCKA